MRLKSTGRLSLPVVAGVVALVLPVAGGAVRSSLGHTTVARAWVRPAGDVVDRAKAQRPAKVKRAVTKSHPR
jgi:uncharacterized protein (DUF697 family)